MEIKAKLLKPYTKNQKIDFILEQNHQLGYEIRETETSLEAWGYPQEETEEHDYWKREVEVTPTDNIAISLMIFGLVTPVVIYIVNSFGGLNLDQTQVHSWYIICLITGVFGFTGIFLSCLCEVQPKYKRAIRKVPLFVWYRLITEPIIKLRRFYENRG